MRLRIHCLLIGSALALLPASAHAQMVGGRVIGDSTRHPLAGVQVRLIDSATKQAVDSARTDSAGIFYTTAPKPGTYSLILSRENSVPRFSGRWTLATVDAFQQATFVLPEGIERIAYTDADVDERVRPVPGNRGPRYPEGLRAKHIAGNVRVRFVVDEEGYVILRTVRVLESTRPEFAQAVQASVGDLRFFPAKRNGVAVAQIACMPMSFRIDPGPDVKQLDVQYDEWVAHPACPTN